MLGEDSGQRTQANASAVIKSVTMETLEERRSLIQQQDMAYEESLWCDRVKNEEKVRHWYMC